MSKLKLCGDRKHPPFEFINEDGEFDGFNIEITKAIAKEMNIDIDIDLMEWADAIRKLDKEECDGIEGMSISEEREKKYTFGPDYITAFHSAFTLKKRDDIKKSLLLKNIKNYKIAVQKDDAGYFLINNNNLSRKKVSLFELSNQEDALKSLLNEEVDIVVGNKITLLYYAQKLKMDEKIKLIENPLGLTKYSIAFNYKNKDMADKFKIGMEKIKNKGIYEKKYNKWFGSNIDYFGKQIIENVEIGVIYIDKLGRISAINNFAKDILSFSQEEIIFKSFYETPLSGIFNSFIIQKMLDNVLDSYNSQIDLNTKEEIRYLEVNYTKLLDEKSKSTGVLINFKDITEKTKLQQRLMRKDKMESLGVILLNIAHELRNPLTSIKNFIELIPENLDDKEFRDSLLFHVPNQINYVNDIFSNLLEYSKPKEAVRTHISIKNLIEDDLLKYMDKFIDKEIQFNIDIEDEFIIKADKTQIKQVLINLIFNSIDSIEENGKIKIYTDEDIENKTIFIEDNGRGISELDLNKIFDPFYTTKKDGTGLGLFISYNLMKENNGTIEITKLDNGTKIALILKK